MFISAKKWAATPPKAGSAQRQLHSTPKADFVPGGPLPLRCPTNTQGILAPHNENVQNTTCLKGGQIL